MLCVIITGPSLAEVQRQLAEANRYASLVELRVDLLAGIDEQMLRELKESYELPMLFTLRSAAQGGAFTGSLEEQQSGIRRLARIGPAYLDIEAHQPAAFFEEIALNYPAIDVICSHHDLAQTPEDLDTLYTTLKMKPAALYKIAGMARSTLDALRLLTWAKDAGDDLIVLSMGPFGQAARVLAPTVASRIAYACLDEKTRTALGQLTMVEMFEIFHYPRLTPWTKIYGLIGNPVDRSISDKMHNALIDALKMDAVYVKMTIKSEELSGFLHYAEQLGIAGLSVTMPLKEGIVPLLPYVDSNAAAIGAVNTIANRKGYNTDSKGALDAIESVSPVAHKRVAIIGAGGAAKAIAYEAKQRGASLAIVNRDRDKAVALASAFDGHAYGLDEMSLCSQAGYDFLINATPVPMPIDPADMLFNIVAMDIKTRPLETEFLIQARAKGCRLVYGYQMFIEQALEQWRLWTQDHIDIDSCRNIFQKTLHGIVHH